MKHPYERQLKAAREFRELMLKFNYDVNQPAYRKELRRLKEKHNIKSRSELKALRASLRYADALAVMVEAEPRLDFFEAMDAIQSFATPAIRH